MGQETLRLKHEKVTQSRRDLQRGLKEGKERQEVAVQQQQQQQQHAKGAEDRDEANERVLRQFDLASKFGPCTGMTRLERWERAEGLGLKPPKQVRDLLEKENTRNECLWEGRI